ncbi:hypothetical protein KA012_03230, partial [Candidatus Woesebacteria bacterium]|nr:hypothetical protein [Candidatus Woesebacteria bacterium]
FFRDLVILGVVVSGLVSVTWLGWRSQDLRQNASDRQQMARILTPVGERSFETGSTVTLRVNIDRKLFPTAATVAFYRMDVSNASDQSKVCTWPGGWTALSQEIALKGNSATLDIPVADLGAYYVVANIRDKNNAPLCAGAFSWDDAQTCSFSYPECPKDLVTVSGNLPSPTPEPITPVATPAVPAATPTPPTTANLNFDAVSTHAVFWKTDAFQYVAKEYAFVQNGRAPINDGENYNKIWWWSGPYYGSKAIGNTQRFVIFQKYRNDSPLDYLEWETWDKADSGKKAVVHQLGGTTEEKAQLYFESKDNCQSGKTGYTWPDIYTGTMNVTPVSRKVNGECTPEYRSGAPGGYTAVRIFDDFGVPASPSRIEKCNEYAPASASQAAFNVCVNSPHTAIVFQQYQWVNQLSPVLDYRTGCEATVYSWGYPESAEKNFQNWFRNGEIRWSYYRGDDKSVSFRLPEDSNYWDTQCLNAFNNRPNAIYTGKYKLNNTEYLDSGN